MSIVSNYWTIPGFEDLYLEDSWVLSIQPDETALSFVVDMVLRESHSQYQSPRPGEQYCYRRGLIRFDSVRSLTWLGGGAAPATDASGEQDLGSFDEFAVVGEAYSIAGDFGRLELIARPPRVEFLE